jgi:hypothetical protein
VNWNETIARAEVQQTLAATSSAASFSKRGAETVAPHRLLTEIIYLRGQAGCMPEPRRSRDGLQRGITVKRTRGTKYRIDLCTDTDGDRIAFPTYARRPRR